MGVVLMSKRELNRVDVLAWLDGRRLTTLAAADLMRVTLRQAAPAGVAVDMLSGFWLARE